MDLITIKTKTGETLLAKKVDFAPANVYDSMRAVEHQGFIVEDELYTRYVPACDVVEIIINGFSFVAKKEED